MQKKMQTNAKKFSGAGVSDIIVQIEELLRKNFINKSQLASYLRNFSHMALVGRGWHICPTRGFRARKCPEKSLRIGKGEGFRV